MLIARIAVALIVLPLALAASAQAERVSLQSDWLELVQGYKGKEMGVELVTIEDDEAPEMQRVMLSIPKSVGTLNEIEEVVVVGKRPESIEFRALDISYEWLDSPDSDKYGLLIHLPRDSDWPIRLYLNSRQGFVD